jgi:transketolase
VIPADIPQAQTALLKTWDYSGPIYYRVGKGDKHALPNLDGQFELGKASQIREGNDLAFISMGGITQEVVQAVDVLQLRGIAASIIVVPSFNPSPEEDLMRMLKEIPLALTVEAHMTTGGLGSFVCEVVAERRLSCQVIRCGINGPIDAVVGSKDFMNQKYRISAPHLAETALKGLENLKNERASHIHYPARP